MYLLNSNQSVSKIEFHSCLKPMIVSLILHAPPQFSMEALLIKVGLEN